MILMRQKSKSAKIALLQEEERPTMKIEEAIKIFEDWAKCNYEPTKQAAQLALTALRSMQEAREPLSLEQLREMDGQPVWIVEYPDWGHWELSEDANDYIVDRNLNFYGMKHDDPDGRYGLHKLGWLAYSYPPAHIDRSGWISVKERLPDFGIPVLICWDGYTDIAEYWCGMVCPKWRTQHYGTVNLTSVTHWMPLPEPPEEG